MARQTLTQQRKAIDDAAREIVLALRWVWGTQRQIERYLVAVREQDYSGFRGDYPTLSQLKGINEELWDVHFMWIAAAQAEKRLRRVARARKDSRFRLDKALADDIRIMRDLSEHYEQHAASFDDPNLPKTKAAARLAKEHPSVHPGVGTIDMNGVWLGPVEINSLGCQIQKRERMLRTALAEKLQGFGITLRE